MPAASGIYTLFFGRLEAAFDQSHVAFIGTDALSLHELKLEPSKEYHESKEHRGSASLQDEIEGAQSGKWSAKGYIRVNAAGVEPHLAMFFRMICGQAPTISGGTSVRYTFANVTLSAQLCRHIPSELTEVAFGAIVEEVTIDSKGGDEPTIEVKGSYARFSWLIANAATTGEVVSTATAFTLAPLHRGKLGVGMRIVIGTDDNSGAGYLITSINHSTGAAVFSPALATTQGAGAPTTIAPLIPTPAYTGTVIPGINCALTISTVTYGWVAGKTTIKTGHRLLDKEQSSDRPTGTARGKREVMVDLEAYWLDDGMPRLGGQAWSGVLQNITQRLGPATAGAHLNVQTPSVRLAVSPIEIPEAEETMIKLAGPARQVSASNDECAFMFD